MREIENKREALRLEYEEKKAEIKREMIARKEKLEHDIEFRRATFKRQYEYIDGIIQSAIGWMNICKNFSRKTNNRTAE